MGAATVVLRAAVFAALLISADAWAAHPSHLDALEGLSQRPAGTASPTGAASGAASESGTSILPGTCQGIDRTTDDATHAVHPDGLPAIKVIYVHPTDQPNRFAHYAPVIQAGISSISDFVAGESNSTKSLRFDIGTAEGPGCVDIQRISLPRDSAYYNSNSSTDPESGIIVGGGPFHRVKDHVRRRLGPQPGVRNFLIYVDGLDRLIGVADVSGDDRPGPDNLANQGGYYAAVFGQGGSDFFSGGQAYPPGTTSFMHVVLALHEVSHNLGAVQLTAPHGGLKPRPHHPRESADC